MRPSFLCLLVVSVLAALPASAPAARAGDSLRTEMAEAAREVKKRLDDRGDRAVVLNAIDGPRKQRGASGGPVLTLYLAEELKKLGVAIKLQAPVGIGGRVRDVIDKQTKLLAAEVVIQMVDHDENPIGPPIVRGVFGDAALSALFGLTGRLPLSLAPQERSKAMTHCLDAPAVFIKGGRVAAAEDGQFAVEVLVEKEARPAVDENGFAFVDVRPGERFSVRLINDGDFEAAAQLRIDGVNVLEFSDLKDPDTAELRTAAYFVPAHSSLVVHGWRIDAKTVQAFAPGAYAREAPSCLRPAADFTTISAGFRACWAKDEPPPADEPRSAVKGPPLGSRDDLFSEASERVLGVEREFVSVRCRHERGEK